MGIRNYLVEGVSGSGKTSVATELERRGYQVFHGDRVLAYSGDPVTGAKLQAPEGLDAFERMMWNHRHWIWPVDRVREVQADRSQLVTFFCGGSRNFRAFIDGFDKAFVLVVDDDTLTGRLAGRGDDEFGGKPEERDLVLSFQNSADEVPESGIRIKSSAPLSEVVDTILRHCDLL